MTLGVIIATMNRPSDLEKALGSLRSQTRMPEGVWIVDQSTDDRTRKLVEQAASSGALRDRLHYVYQEEKSLVKARNRGMDLAKGEILSFLDDDIVLDADYFERIVSVFSAHPDVVGVSGNARVTEHWHGWRWGLRMSLSHLFLINHYDGRMTLSGLGYPIFDREIDRTRAVEMLPGCNMNYRASVLGGERFDEFFSGYSYREDAEFSYRLSKKGKLLQVHDARLWHHYSTSNRLTEAQLRTMKAKNYDYMFRKFKRGPVARAFFAYSMLGLSFIDLIEYLTGRTASKRDKLHAGWDAFIRVMRGHDRTQR